MKQIQRSEEDVYHIVNFRCYLSVYDIAEVEFQIFFRELVVLLSIVTINNNIRLCTPLDMLRCREHAR